MKALLIGGLSAALLATGAYAQPLEPKDQVKNRKAGYQFMAWNMGKIKAQVVDESVPYDPLKVQAAANAIAAVANSGMGELFSPGTSRAELGKQTRLKADFFKNLDEASRLGREFNLAANQLASVAASGDKGAIKAAFGETGKTCKSCHDKFRHD